ncbi:hypothetical protein EVAR_8536_1 [Eumeta japonica]|uniref:Histone-lysine N-methyltransferase SETMAR n=1 Tax=Eumeta variegata TaxID=151549 RepID=A0A4C1TXD1_EUMVA|nr:hypothetical protein EVAR_8536_1 [Eumeta japonica]
MRFTAGQNHQFRSLLPPADETQARSTEKRRPEMINRKRVVFHHDNARPHTFLATQQILRQFGWKGLMHLPNSPDLVSSDRSLQNYLCSISEETISSSSSSSWLNLQPVGWGVQVLVWIRNDRSVEPADFRQPLARNWSRDSVFALRALDPLLTSCSTIAIGIVGGIDTVTRRYCPPLNSAEILEPQQTGACGRIVATSVKWTTYKYNPRSSTAVKLVTKASQWRKIRTQGRRKGRGLGDFCTYASNHLRAVQSGASCPTYRPACGKPGPWVDPAGKRHLCYTASPTLPVCDRRCLPNEKTIGHAHKVTRAGAYSQIGRRTRRAAQTAAAGDAKYRAGETMPQ